MNGENTEQVNDEMANDEQVRAKISQRAYEIYLSRGGEPGSAMDDWLQACGRRCRDKRRRGQVILQQGWELR
jgi:hypothetical protein